MSKGNKEEQKWLLGESLNQYDRSLKEELNKVEKRNREQNHKISALINAFDDDYIKKEEENTNISLDYSKEGIVIVDDIKGNTLVNNVKDSNKELVLNGDIDTQGVNNVTLEGTVDNGKVDVSLEGNTMVNVCDQEDPIAITKNYEVTTGNHMALQGEYDGKCRPNIYGNTLVNLWDIKSSEISGQVVKTDTTIKIKTTDNIYSNFFMRDKKMFKPSTEYTFIINVIKNTLVDDSTIRITSIADGTNRDIFNNSYGIQGGKTGIFIVKLTTIADFSQANFGVRSFFNNPSQTPNCEAELNIIILEGDYTNKPIPEYFTGMQSSFEDKLITDEKDAHNGKYKVDYKVTGKNKCPRCITTSTSGNGITFTYDATTQTFSYSGTATNTSTFLSIPCPNLKLLKDKSYIFSVDNPLTDFSLQATELGVGYNCNLPPGQSATPIVNLDKFTSNAIMLYSQNLTIGQSYSGTFKVQIEQGTKVTEYEPYKENNITFYIKEPLRGIGDIKDKVYVKEDKVVVQRNCGSVTFDGSDTWNLNKIENNIYTYSIRSTKFLTKMKVGTWETLMNNKCYIIDKCGTATTSTPKNEQLLIHNTVEDKFIWYSTPLFSTVQSVKQYLNDNPFKILYQLETPVYEEVEYSNNRLTLNSYNNSTLFYNTNIPVSNTSFKPLWEELVYVKNSTTYYIQFNAIGSGDVVVNLGGTELSTTITEGYNKIEITTPNESTNLLTINGQGIKISKVVVSEALCSGYYKGLQSCFEEHMENGKYVCVIRGISLDGNKVNGIKFHLNEPLRGIGDIKDRLCIKDNKLMVERNCNSIILNDSDDKTIWIDGASEGCVNTKLYATRPTNHPFGKDNGNMIADNLIVRNIYNTDDIDGMWYRGNAFRIRMFNSKLSTQDLAGFKKYLQQNPITVAYQLATPVYEEVTNEYGLPIILEGYENGIVYVDSAVTPTTSIKYTSNNTVPTTLSNVDNLNTTTQDDINNNIVTYMMDIDMMLTEMEMEDNASTMSLSDSDDNNQKHNTSHNNILDRMNKEDRIKYQDNTTKMLEKVIKGKSLTNEENINRIDLYLSEGKIREEQSNYLKELLKEGE